MPRQEQRRKQLPEILDHALGTSFRSDSTALERQTMPGDSAKALAGFYNLAKSTVAKLKNILLGDVSGRDTPQ